MGLETATFIAGLTPTWPIASEPKSQGDDHLRLIKSALQATFPTASKTLYFPKVETGTATMVLDATDQNNFIALDTTGGNINVTLPAGLAVADNGWSCQIVKTSPDGNAIIVAAASGNIASQVGSTASIRVGTLCSPATFVWTGASWICVKYGPLIGSTTSFDGPNLPAGYLIANGATGISSVLFAELAAMLNVTPPATFTISDKRGRVEAGVDGGAGRILNMIGSALGAVGGVEWFGLVAGHIPNLSGSGSNSITVYPAGSAGYMAPLTTAGSWGQDIVSGVGVSGSFCLPYTGVGQLSYTNAWSGTNSISVTVSGSGGSTGVTHQNMPPTITVQKLIRAC